MGFMTIAETKRREAEEHGVLFQDHVRSARLIKELYAKQLFYREQFLKMAEQVVTAPGEISLDALAGFEDFVGEVLTAQRKHKEFEDQLYQLKSRL
jgi:hypothetical protein